MKFKNEILREEAAKLCENLEHNNLNYALFIFDKENAGMLGGSRLYLTQIANVVESLVTDLGIDEIASLTHLLLSVERKKQVERIMQKEY